MKIPNSVKKRLEAPLAIRIWRFFMQQSLIVLGAVTSALGYALFQVPFKLAAGGVSGLAIIVNNYTGWSVGTLFLLINIPLLVLGFFKLGRFRFLVSSILAVVTFSVAADVFSQVMPTVLDRFPITDDALLAAIYAGILFGLGMGVIYRAGGLVGGTSIPARILYNATGFPMSQTFLVTDLAVIALAGVVFNWEAALLAVLTLVLAGLLSEFVFEGSSQMRSAVIVTEKPEDMRYAIMHEMRRGLSLWPVVGGYSSGTRTMIYCTIRRSRMFDLKYLVSRIDPKAMLIIGVVQQAWGGYGNRKLKVR